MSWNWIKRLGRTFVAAFKDYSDDNGPQWAAAIAYYSLLSVFPLLLAVGSIAAFFVDPQWAVDQITSAFGDLIPQGQVQIEEVVKGAIQARGPVSIFSILSLLWTGSRVFSTITKALNVAYDVEDDYGFFKRLLIQLAMLTSVGLLFLLALLARPVLFPILQTAGLLPQELSSLLRLGITALPIFLLLLAFVLTYRFVPRRNVSWQAAFPAAVFATLLFAIARPLFDYYLGRFANYNLIYGSLAIAVIIILWAWIVGQILILGGEVASYIQRVLVEGQSIKNANRV